jgi:hypothetical protein
MGERKTARRTSVVLAWASAAALALTGCGDDAQYVGSPAGPVWRIGAAGTDRDGTVAVTGDDRAVTVPSDDGDATGETFGAPAKVGTDRDPKDVSVDASRTAWVLVGRSLVPVRARDAAVHARAAALQTLNTRDSADVLPGVVPDGIRWTDAVAVVDDETVVVGNRSSVLGSSEARVNSVVHRIGPDGRGTLLAGRAWTGSPDRPRPATEIAPGATAPATDVDLDDIAALQPLDGDRLLIVTSVPTEDTAARLSFFVLDGDTLRRLDVPDAYTRPTGRPVTTSLTGDGKVVVNLALGAGDRPKPAAVSLDPGSGGSSVIERFTPTTEGAAPLMTADADGDALIVVTPPGGDPDDDENGGSARLTTAPVPGD